MTSWHWLDRNSPLCYSGHPHRAVVHYETCERPIFFWQMETDLMYRSCQMASDVPVTGLYTWICLSESGINYHYKETVSFEGGGDTYNVQDTQSLTEKDSRPSDLLLKFSLALRKEWEHGTSRDAFLSKLFYIFMIL